MGHTLCVGRKIQSTLEKNFVSFVFPDKMIHPQKRTTIERRLYLDYTKKESSFHLGQSLFREFFFFCFTQKRCQLFFFFYSTQEKTISLNEEKSVLWSPRVEFVYNPNILRLIDCITTRSKSESNFWKKVKIHLFFFFFL